VEGIVELRNFGGQNVEGMGVDSTPIPVEVIVNITCFQGHNPG
jgi:hypothetical protein